MTRIPEIKSANKESKELQITFLIDNSDISPALFSRIYHSLQNSLNELLQPQPFKKEMLTFDDVRIIKPANMSGDLANAAARFNKRTVLWDEAKRRLKSSISENDTH